MSVPRTVDLEDLLIALAPSGSYVEATSFPSGALDVLVRRSDGPIVRVQGLADGSQFGITPELEPDAGFDDGHPIVVNSFGEMLAALVDAVVNQPNR